MWHEPRNYYDCYALAVMKHMPGTLVDSVLRHLPRELSRFLFFITSHGASVSCTATNIHHRRSPLVQGGLEIPCEVVVKMLSCEKNVVAIDKLKILVIDHYQ